MKTTAEQFQAARRAGVPLIAISTTDPMALVIQLSATLREATNVQGYDCMRGVWGISEGSEDMKDVAGDPAVMLQEFAPELQEDSVLFALGMDEWIDEKPVKQGVWNLRNPYKSTRRTLVMVGTTLALPASLANDVVMIDDQLPGEEELRMVIKEIDKAATESIEGRPLMKKSEVAKAVDCLRGLSLYSAEQLTALNITEKGIDLDGLWDAKRSQIEQTPGISVWKGGESFTDIGGLDALKVFSQRIIEGREPPRGIVFLDEIEKLLAGSGGGDSSGVSQGMLQAILTYMSDYEVAGMILIGPPGTGKSMIAKAFGNEADIPTIAFDTNAMKASLVGESEKTMRNALKVVTGVTGGQSLWIATCNSISDLPPELRRRFTLGTFFVDLPTTKERAAIWKAYKSKWNLKDSPSFKDAGWTGAEIRNCCHLAYRMNISLDDAGKSVIPVSIAAYAEIDKLRTESAGRYLSAAKEGETYTKPKTKVVSRKLGLN